MTMTTRPMGVSLGQPRHRPSTARRYQCQGQCSAMAQVPTCRREYAPAALIPLPASPGRRCRLLVSQGFSPPHPSASKLRHRHYLPAQTRTSHPFQSPRRPAGRAPRAASSPTQGIPFPNLAHHISLGAWTIATDIQPRRCLAQLRGMGPPRQIRSQWPPTDVVLGDLLCR